MLICPVCKSKLTKLDNRYVCENNHSFDIAKQGYCNLLLANNKKCLDPGDNMVMTNARHKFLTAGYFSNLAETIGEIILKLGDNLNIVDSGCCEGYYTNHIANINKSNNVLGLDISKSGIIKASKTYKTAKFFVASCFNPPIADCSVDAITKIFAPLALPQFLSMLKPNGIFIEVVPAPNHLIELKNKLYDNVYLNQMPTSDYSGFTLLDSIRLTNNIEICSTEQILNLFTMTPYYFRTAVESAKTLQNLTRLSVTTDFIINVFKKS